MQTMPTVKVIVTDSEIVVPTSYKSNAATMLVE